MWKTSGLHDEDLHSGNCRICGKRQGHSTSTADHHARRAGALPETTSPPPIANSTVGDLLGVFVSEAAMAAAPTLLSRQAEAPPYAAVFAAYQPTPSVDSAFDESLDSFASEQHNEASAALQLLEPDSTRANVASETPHVPSVAAAPTARRSIRRAFVEIGRLVTGGAERVSNGAVLVVVALGHVFRQGCTRVAHTATDVAARIHGGGVLVLLKMRHVFHKARTRSAVIAIDGAERVRNGGIVAAVNLTQLFRRAGIQIAERTSNVAARADSIAPHLAMPRILPVFRPASIRVDRLANSIAVRFRRRPRRFTERGVGFLCGAFVTVFAGALIYNVVVTTGSRSAPMPTTASIATPVATTGTIAGTTSAVENRLALSAVGAPSPSEARRQTPVVFRGALSVKSRPSGASVFLNGQLAGTTPIVLRNLRVGSRAVRLELQDQRWSGTVQIVANRLAEISAGLEYR